MHTFLVIRRSNKVNVSVVVDEATGSQSISIGLTDTASGLCIDTADTQALVDILNAIQQVAPELLGYFPEPEPHHLEQDPNIAGMEA